MSNGDYLSMCKVCAASSMLPESYFPQQVNEAMCASDAMDANCFFEPDTGIGQSQSILLLRKVIHFRIRKGYGK